MAVNKPKHLRPLATARRKRHMVRRGSTVRVRQRALQEPRKARNGGPRRGQLRCRSLRWDQRGKQQSAARGRQEPPQRRRGSGLATAHSRERAFPLERPPQQRLSRWNKRLEFPLEVLILRFGRLWGP